MGPNFYSPKFIKDIISLVEKMFLTKHLKLAIERNFYVWLNLASTDNNFFA